MGNHFLNIPPKNTHQHCDCVSHMCVMVTMTVGTAQMRQAAAAPVNSLLVTTEAVCQRYDYHSIWLHSYLTGDKIKYKLKGFIIGVLLYLYFSTI